LFTYSTPENPGLQRHWKKLAKLIQCPPFLHDALAVPLVSHASIKFSHWFPVA